MAIVAGHQGLRQRFHVTLNRLHSVSGEHTAPTGLLLSLPEVLVCQEECRYRQHAISRISKVLMQQSRADSVGEVSFRDSLC